MFTNCEKNEYFSKTGHIFYTKGTYRKYKQKIFLTLAYESAHHAQSRVQNNRWLLASFTDQSPTSLAIVYA